MAMMTAAAMGLLASVAAAATTLTADLDPIASGPAGVLDCMRESATRLAAQDPGGETQELQRRAVAELDAMIARLRDQPPQSPATQPGSTPAPSAQPNPSSSAPGTATHAGPGGTGGHGAAGVTMTNCKLFVDGTEWIILSQAERTVIINRLGEGALKSYAAKVRSYYETLAESGRPRQN